MERLVRLCEKDKIHPERVVSHNPHNLWGEVIDVVVPGEGGVRFTIDHKMIGFLEP